MPDQYVPTEAFFSQATTEIPSAEQRSAYAAAGFQSKAHSEHPIERETWFHSRATQRLTPVYAWV